MRPGRRCAGTRRRALAAWGVLTVTVAWCMGAAPALAQSRLDVGVSILPQAYLVERVGGEHVRVHVLVNAGQSPHTFEPSPKQLVALAEARVYFQIGVDFERATVPRLERMFPNLELVDLRQGITLRMMEGPGCDHGHEAGHDHEQHAGQPDPHTWLSPRLAQQQAKTICETLCRIDPAHTESFRRNLAALQTDLERVHHEIAESLAPLKGREVYVFHPAFGYFLDEFGLKQVAVEIEGKQPAPRQLAALIERARAAGVRAIFVQPQFSPKSAATIADAIGGVVIPIDPLARDYLANLQHMAEQLKRGLQPAPA